MHEPQGRPANAPVAADPPTPVVAFTVSVDALQVTVDTSATTPNVGVRFIYSWGDGTISRTGSHQYARPGAYDVVVTATNSAGASTAATAVTATA